MSVTTAPRTGARPSSCYYSGNFVTGFAFHGYVQKIFASIRKAQYAVRTRPKAVRIIPYNSKTQRKIARDDHLPLGETGGPSLAAAGQRVPSVVASPYPEPSAIRRYLPSTPLADTATALAHASAIVGESRKSTAENRAAIPVPGPGAMMPTVSSNLATGISGIPVQVVGVDGDPYKTAIANSAHQSVVKHGLPMPNPDAALSVDVSKSSRAEKTSPNAMAAHKGGALLQIHEATRSAAPQNGTAQAMTDRSSELTAPQSSDESFVF